MPKLVSTGRTISTTEYQERKRRARRRKLILVGALVAAVLAGAVIILRLGALRIKEVVVEGALATSPAAVQALASERLAGNYLFLLPRESIFLYPRGGIERAVTAAFPRFGAVSVSLHGLSTLFIEVSEREPFAIFCAETCFFLDEGGFIFDKAPSFSEDVYVVYHAEGVAPALGESLLTRESFANVARFVNFFSAMKLVPREVFLKGDAATLSLSSGAEVLWRARDEAEKLEENLKAFLESDALKSETRFWERAATVDLRTPNKVFYTFKTESAEQE